MTPMPSCTQSEPSEPATRTRSYSLRSPNRERRKAGSPDSASLVLHLKTLPALNDHSALGEAGVRTARFGERSEYEGSLAPASHSARLEETTGTTAS